MVTVEVDPVRVESRLAAGEIGCPRCGDGVLTGWGHARSRWIDGLADSLRPRRARCRSCRATHVLLPVTVLLRRAYAAERIWAALTARSNGEGHRRIGVSLGVPAATVRGWLRAGDCRVDRPDVIGGHIGERDLDIALSSAAALVDVHRVTAARGETDHLQLGADVLGLGIPAERYRAGRLGSESGDDRRSRHRRSRGRSRGRRLRRTRTARRNACGDYGSYRHEPHGSPFVCAGVQDSAPRSGLAPRADGGAR